MEGALNSSPQALGRRIRQQVGARRHVFFAIVPPGFEGVCAAELQSLGIQSEPPGEKGGIAWSGRLESCWRVHIGARTLNRVLMRLVRFRAVHFPELREKTAAFPWELYLPGGQNVTLRVSARKSRLFHGRRIAAEVEAGISQRLEKFDRSLGFAGTDAATADNQSLFVRLDEDRCQLSLDASGDLLYRRGLNRFTGPAPLRETLAAAILRAARIEEHDMLIEPLAGSGVFSLEAGMMAANSLPGALRRFAFEAWPSFRPPAYRQLLKTMATAPGPVSLKRIWLGDVDGRVLAAARRNVEAAGLGGMVEIEQRDFLSAPVSPPPEMRCLVAINPPYGGRLQPATALRDLYRRLGRVLQTTYANCSWAVIVPGLEIEKSLSIPHDMKIPFFNGGFPVALLVRFAPGSAHRGGA